jgi:hypothetical protein
MEAKRDGGGHREHVSGARFAQTSGCFAQLIEGRDDRPQVGLARLGQGERLVAALEERHADEFLQRLDLAADGRLGEEQLAAAFVKLRCRAAASKPRRKSSGGRGRLAFCMRSAHANHAGFSFEALPHGEHSACVALIQQGTDMDLYLEAPAVALDTGDVISLDDAEGVRIQTRTGTVWVTEEDDLEDHIIGPATTSSSRDPAAPWCRPWPRRRSRSWRPPTIRPKPPPEETT